MPCNQDLQQKPIKRIFYFSLQILYWHFKLLRTIHIFSLSMRLRSFLRYRRRATIVRFFNWNLIWVFLCFCTHCFFLIFVHRKCNFSDFFLSHSHTIASPVINNNNGDNCASHSEMNFWKCSQNSLEMWKERKERHKKKVNVLD